MIIVSLTLNAIGGRAGLGFVEYVDYPLKSGCCLFTDGRIWIANQRSHQRLPKLQAGDELVLILDIPKHMVRFTLIRASLS